MLATLAGVFYLGVEYGSNSERVDSLTDAVGRKDEIEATRQREREVAKELQEKQNQREKDYAKKDDQIDISVGDCLNVPYSDEFVNGLY